MKIIFNTHHRVELIINDDPLLPLQTTNPKVFAEGDIVRGSDLVVTAIVQEKKQREGIFALFILLKIAIFNITYL